jgi:hypothetical protein
MAKASASNRTRAAKPAEGARKGNAGRIKTIQRAGTTGPFVASAARFEAVMQAAEQSGLLGEKSGRIGGRVSAALLEQAKRRTGIESDTELIAFALASIALDDRFAEAFRQSRGKVPPELKLGF